jgi:hypothetical protein
MPELKYTATLGALSAGGVDFTLVGGLAAVLSGAPINTFDVDVVHSREPGNIHRLLPVLDALDAVFRIQAKPNESAISTSHQPLATPRRRSTI